jgi:hypothetical protein
MKTIKFFGTLVALAVLAIACTKSPLIDLLETETETITPPPPANDPVVFHVTWDGVDKSTGKFIQVNAVPSDRTNSANNSSIKISSQTHKLPDGMVFHWSMHKDHNAHRGFLRVDARMFDKYESFVITTQQSNVYRDYLIKPVGEPVGGAYLFRLNFVASQTNPTSVNNVWIGTFVEKEKKPVDPIDPPVEPELFTVTFVCYNNGSPIAGLNSITPEVREGGFQRLLESDVNLPVEHLWNIPRYHEIVWEGFRIVEGHNAGGTYKFGDPVLSNLVLTVIVAAEGEGIN